MYIFIYVYIYICIYLHVYIFIYVYIYILYIFIYCIYLDNVCMFICVYIYTVYNIIIFPSKITNKSIFHGLSARTKALQHAQHPRNGATQAFPDRQGSGVAPMAEIFHEQKAEKHLGTVNKSWKLTKKTCRCPKNPQNNFTKSKEPLSAVNFSISG